MALPAVLVPAARVASSALVQAAPAIKDKVLSYVRAATDGSVSTMPAVAEKLNKDRNGFSLVVTSLVNAGVHPHDIFDEKLRRETRDQETTRLVQRLESEYHAIYGSIDASSAFKPGGDQIGDAELGASVLKRLRRRLFGVNAREDDLRAFHRDLRLFTQMSDRQLEDSMLLKTAWE